ncbi:uncharacterized protein PAC_08753 [Phialocephala subalpina]|uniref:Uncharacterized protein n=1 Tax=Phialocephala subalpina TaxID=576137 RepID=A0A1L7X1F7_9HELO|nr:uncharacterized protein PAC_08753 [Phialocephala subalpina]
MIMQSLWGSPITRVELEQSISRLRQLDQLPEVPRENFVLLHDDPTHLLVVEREKEIASNLAFLSAISDDSLKVMAVCIEEHRNGKGCTIRVASNIGDFSMVTDGFSRLARVWEQAARRGNSRSEDIDIAFREVVDLDLPRILSRLRSRHSSSRKIAGKRALVEQLHDALHDSSIRVTTAIKENRREVRDLRSLFVRLEGIADLDANIIEAKEVVGVLVKQMYAFSSTSNLGAALRNSTLEPSLKTYLPEAIGKLGRYYSATSELVCAARNQAWRLFENVEVEPFQIQIPAALQKSHWKVHAEMQLLFFYETHLDHLRPRFICSSKSACYLCNLFFTLHGGFHIPKTHGRLYDKWTLPDWLDVPTECRENLGRISTLLKATIDGKVQRALRSRKKKVYHYPNESVLPQLASWPASCSSRSLLARSSTSTIRPPTPVFQAGSSSKRHSQCTAMPLTPPTTPPQPECANLSPSEATVGLNTPGLAASQNHISRLTIKEAELPHSRLVDLTTPSLRLQLGTLSLTLEFLHVSSGRLSITCGDIVTLGEGDRIVDINDIPTTTELQLCAKVLDELTFWLRTSHGKVIRISFAWEEQIT